nr:unnamed protein product [Digitaria exilis]
MGKQKIISKSEEDSSNREKYISWSEEATKYMLEWYIDIRKDKPATFRFKKQHHLQCADALNAKFALGVTQNQVDRHYRSCKEKWGWVRRAPSNSGNGFDSTLCKFTLSESEKENLSKATVNYLTRPIRFYHLLEELFIDQSQADGSFAADQTTVNIPDGSDDNEGIKEIEGYNFTADTDEDADSDNIARHSPKTDLDGNPPSKKRKCEKSNSKKSAKSKVSTTDVSASIAMLVDSLLKPPPPPPIPVQPVVPADPYANLWKRINDLTITSKDKLVIVDHLSKPNQDVLRSYLNCSPDSMLHEWVINFFEHAGGSSSAF